jgi:hypothetical protein
MQQVQVQVQLTSWNYYSVALSREYAASFFC